MIFENIFQRKSKLDQSEKRMPIRPAIESSIEEGDNRTARDRMFAEHKYTTIDGINHGELFDLNRNFIPVDGTANRVSAFKTPAKEAVPEAQDNREAELARQQALKIPEGLQGKDLLTALEVKRDEFASYFDTKWNGKIFEDNPEKDADFDCLAMLQGRAAAARVKVKYGEEIQMRLEKIAQAEIAQIRANLQTEQRKLLEELNRTSADDSNIRRDIHASIRKLGDLLKPENEKKLRAWWDERAQSPSVGREQTSSGNNSSDDSNWDT